MGDRGLRRPVHLGRLDRPSASVDPAGASFLWGDLGDEGHEAPAPRDQEEDHLDAQLY